MKSSGKLAALLPLAIWAASCSKVEVAGSETQEIVAPSEGLPLPSTISAASNERFDLYLDSNLNNKLIYYIPRHGRIAVDSPEARDPIPRLSAFARTISDGLFQGQEMVNLGGKMVSSASIHELNQLEREVKAAGYTMQPAPITSTKTDIILGTRFLTDDQRLDVKCERTQKAISLDGQPIMANECFVRSQEGGPYDLNTEVVYAGDALRVSDGRRLPSIPFSVQLVPGMTPIIEGLLENGGNWDSIIQARLNYKISAQRLTHRARLEVEWSKFYEASAKFQAYHDGACRDIEVKEFLSEQVTCKKKHGEPLPSDGCPVKITWYDGTGQVRSNDATNPEFLAAVEAAKKELEGEVFKRVAYINPDTDKVDNSVTAQYVLRTNHRRVLDSGKLVRDVYFNPGAETINAETNMTISCVKGNLRGKAEWNMESEACRMLIGQ